MDEEWASVPRRDVKLDQAIARNSKRRNPIEFRSRAVGRIVWWSDADEPFLALHRPKALTNTPMTCHVGKYKSPFLQLHDPQSRRAVGECQFGLFDAGFSARTARPDNFAIRRKRFGLQSLSGELNHDHPPLAPLGGSLSPQTSHGNMIKGDSAVSVSILRAQCFRNVPRGMPPHTSRGPGSAARPQCP